MKKQAMLKEKEHSDLWVYEAELRYIKNVLVAAGFDFVFIFQCFTCTCI